MKLRIETNRDERKSDSGVMAYTFNVHNGFVSFGEEWPGHDEIYAAGISIAVPQRIWAEAWPWLLENAKPTPHNRGRRCTRTA